MGNNGKPRRPPVTPEVAGSSPVAPVSQSACKLALVDGESHQPTTPLTEGPAEAGPLKEECQASAPQTAATEVLALAAAAGGVEYLKLLDPVL